MVVTLTLCETKHVAHIYNNNFFVRVAFFYTKVGGCLEKLVCQKGYLRNTGHFLKRGRKSLIFVSSHDIIKIFKEHV